MSGQPIARALTATSAEQTSERAAALFDFHHQRLYRLARRLTSSTDDALDLVQETFLRAARSPDSVPYGIEREEAWLVRVDQRRLHPGRGATNCGWEAGADDPDRPTRPPDRARNDDSSKGLHHISIRSLDADRVRTA
jgi:DNA-directed RNA polymerase specialized sigma24 family protein